MMDANIRIAQVTPQDIWDMQDVFYRTWLVTYPNAEYGITVEDVEDRFRDRHKPHRLEMRRKYWLHPPENTTMLVAKEDCSVIGVCCTIQHPDKNELHAIYVLPEYHGLGIGTSLWNAALCRLDANKPWVVEVATYNSKAITFYNHHGFVDTGRRFTDPRLTMKSGAVIPQMEMVRESPL